MLTGVSTLLALPDRAVFATPSTSSILLPPLQVKTIFSGPHIFSDSTFTTSATWDALNNFGNPVSWYDTIWFPRSIPKHAFIAWLVVLNRLPTRDHLQNWRITTDSNCLLCSFLPKNRSHLFFQCSYSYEVWSSFSQSHQTFPPEYDDILRWIPQLLRRISGMVILIFQACIYNICRAVPIQ